MISIPQERKGERMAENREYISCPDELGCIHISEEVLAVTAAVAALEVEGVDGLAANLGHDIAELLAGKKNLSKGVRVAVTENVVTVDISVLVRYGFSIQKAARAVQDAVAAAIENASSLKVDGVNVHVVGVTFDSPKKPR